MKALQLRFGIVVAGLLLSAGPVLAQRPEPAAGSGSDRGGSTASGGGASNAGGGNIASSGSAATTSSSSSGGGLSSPSAAAVSAPSISMGDRAFRANAPEHRVNYSESAAPRQHNASGDGQRSAPRTAAPASGGQSATPRSAAPAGDGQRSAPRASGEGQRSAPRAASGDNQAPRERAVARGNAASGTPRTNEAAGTNNASGASEVPNWSRPRGDRPATGGAVTRVGPPPDRNGHHGNDGGYYYDPYYYGGFGYGFGFGYGGFYDSSYYGYPFYSPFGFGYGIPSGYFDPYFADPYDYGGGYGAYSSRVYGGHDQGALKLKVKPRNAKVYVDGYYVGLVDEFDGAFQKLTLNGGRHKVELRAEGYETTEFDVLVTPEQTVTFAGDMKKTQ